MAAKKKYAKAGQPTKYTPRLPNKMIKYFRDRHAYLEALTAEEIKDNAPWYPSLLRFATIELGVSLQSLRNWSKKYPAFSDAYDLCMGIEMGLISHYTLHGVYHGGHAQLLLKNFHNWQDKLEIDSTSTINLAFDKQDEDL